MKIKKNIALSDTGFVFDPSTGNSFTTNPIGMDIIKLLKEEKNGSEIKEAILHIYETDDVTFEKDYYDFVNMLHKLKITEGNAKETN
ncbi:MAG: PqqD family protein [Bacteroidota bacterium]